MSFLAFKNTSPSAIQNISSYLSSMNVKNKPEKKGADPAFKILPYIRIIPEVSPSAVSMDRNWSKLET